MSVRQWLQAKVWGSPVRPLRDDHTTEVIAEAEQTRVELTALTGRLDEYVADLRARVRLELRHDIITRAANHGRT